MSMSLHSIDKLDDNNYSSWAVQMKSVLVHMELWNIVCGKVVLARGHTTEQAAMFEAKDEKALASIMLCVKPMQINHIRNCKTSLSAWQKLQEIYQPSGPMQKVSLFKKLLYKKLGEGDSVSQYLNEFLDTVEKLAQIGVEVLDEVLVIMLLSNLPESYENFIVAIETRDKLPTLSAIKTKLLEEEMRRNERSEESAVSSGNQAFVAKDNVSGNMQQNSKRNAGHNKKVNVKCYNCGRRGHFAAKCHAPKKMQDSAAKSFNILSHSSKNSLSKNMWCIDSGATCHLSCDRNLFSKFIDKYEKIAVAGNMYIEAKGVGDVVIDSGYYKITLRDVLFVPELQCNFISVTKAVSNNLKVIFDDKKAVVKDQNNDILVSAVKRDGLYILENKLNRCFYTNKSAVSLKEWHDRFGHLNFESLIKMINKNMVSGLNANSTSPENCLTCAKGKICVKPFCSSDSRCKELLNLVHSDVCGPMNTTSFGGAKYFITFIDDSSRYVQVYFLKTKNEALNAFKNYKAMAENETGQKIKALRSDNGGEYVSMAFDTFLNQNGIKHQLTVPYTPQQNGVAERANRTLTEMARCMLIHSCLEDNFWAEAIATAVYLRNRVETRTLPNKTPYEIWYKKIPSVKHLRVFGSPAVVLDKTHRKKFQAKGKEVIMVGYSTTSKAYRLFDPKTRNVIVGRDVVFLSSLQNKDKVVPNDTMVFVPANVVDCDDSANEISSDMHEEEPEMPTESTVAETAPLRYRPGRPKIVRTGKPGRPRKSQQVVSLAQNILNIPETVKEAVTCDLRDEWLQSMKHEYDGLMRNNTWSLVDLPKGEQVIGCKWVFNVKRNSDGSVKKFKSRLVAKGCAQKFGVNYTETFSPVIRYETIRMVVAMAVEHELHLHQLDVSSAYLNSDLKDVVYMKQPEHFVSQEYPSRVCKLRKALYGLKQSGREWNEKLDTVLKKIGFDVCPSEPCLYTKNDGVNFNIIAVYVDDLLLACSRKEDVVEIKEKIEQEFDIMDGGNLHHFLGMQFEREGETGSITICQQNYIEDMLKEYGMTECKSVSTPMDANLQVTCKNKECQRVDETKYQSLIGALMYLALSTRPDILHAACKLAQCNAEPHIEHMTSAKRILRYLSATKDYKLHYFKTNQPITCYVDADWGADCADRKSFTGCVFIAAGGVFAWESKKQNVVALSSTEAEYVALSSAAKESVYVMKLLEELGFGLQGPMVINSDNQSAQYLVKNPVFHNRSKHIDVRYHHIRNLYKENKIALKYCPTDKMISDILTKSLAKTKHEIFTKNMGIY